jgi:citrate lyase subunit beta/citryl-CoA lyase
MAVTARPRRSVLYMPGSNARALDKARSIPADGLILDLEDATAPDAKPMARAQIAATLKAGGFGARELIVRINGLDTPWGKDDLAAAAKAGPDAILLPKVESRAQVLEVVALMEKHGAPAGTAIWCMMETPMGILHAEEIAAAPRVACLVMGTNDLVKDVQARHTALRLPIVTALSHCMLAARAYGLAILDGVYNDLNDDGGFTAVCQQGVEFGFDGKTLIHPKQVAPCNAAYAPSAEEIASSRRIIEGFEKAQAEGKAVVLVDGKLVENLHVENARRIVAMAETIERMAAA